MNEFPSLVLLDGSDPVEEEVEEDEPADQL
jgi:hypothetical protein